MARMQQTTRASGITQSRIATTPADRLRVAKQQLQSSNNAQTKLHTMFEDMIQELEDTKKELEDTKSRLEATEEELEETKKLLEVNMHRANDSFFSWDEELKRLRG